MSNPSLIADCLQQTLTGTTQSIKKAQLALEQMQKDPNFLPNLLIIVRQQNAAANLRKSAALFTKKLIKTRLIEQEQSQLNSTAQLLLQQLSQTTTQLPIRRLLCSSFQYLLMNDTKFTIRQKLNPYCLKLLEQTKIQQNDANINYQFIGFFVQAFINSFLHSNKEKNLFIQATLSTFSALSLRLFKFVDEIVAAGDKNKVLHLFRILKLYSYTFRIYIKQMLYSEIQSAKLLYDESITLLISTSLNLTLKNNQLKTNIIYYNPSIDSQILQLFHLIKSDYIQSVQYILRTISMLFKDRQMIQSNSILSSPALIPSLVNSINQLLNICTYHSIKSPSLVKLLESILHFFIHAVRNMFYFQWFQECKKEVVHGIVLKILMFSKADCQCFVDDPDQFVNKMLQVVQMDTNQYFKNHDKEVLFSEKNQQIQEYTNLRTLAATLLQALCKHVDGSLPQILNFSLQVLQNKTQSDVPKSLLMLMLCILRPQIRDRDEISQIMPTLTQLLKSRGLPTPINQTQSVPLTVYEQNIQYFIILLTVYRYLNIIQQLRDDDLRVIYGVVYGIVQSSEVSNAIKVEAFDLIYGLCERQEVYEVKFMQLMNNLIMTNSSFKQRCLQTMSALYSSPACTLANHIAFVTLTVKNMSAIVESELQKKQNLNQLLINKCWNVLGSIYQNQKFIPAIIPDMQQSIMPLIPYIDGQRNFDFEQDIFMMMSSFIQKSKCVTQNQLIMFQIIPKLFYTQYQYRFGHAFETLHIFMLYGKNILTSAPQAIKAIIQMAVCGMNTTKFKESNRSESDNCEGVIIIQSLILSCGDCFTPQIWIQLAKALTTRLDNPPIKTHILHSNILGCLALILMKAHTCFSPEDCDILLNRILQNFYCFVVKYSIKLAIVSFSYLLTQFHLPFIFNRFTLLLDTTLTLLQSHDKKEVFNRNALTDEERDYDVLLDTIKNWMVNADEVQYFRKRVLEVKEKNVEVLKKGMEGLGEKKVEYLKKIVNTVSIKNQSRPVFKIKK